MAAGPLDKKHLRTQLKAVRRGLGPSVRAEADAAVAARVKIPIIASGGAGRMEDFKELFALEGVDAGLAASIFHFREIEIMDLKRYLAGCGVNVRM